MPFQGFPLLELRVLKKKKSGFSLQEELTGREKRLPKRAVLELGAGSGHAGCVPQPHRALWGRSWAHLGEGSTPQANRQNISL